MLRRQENINQLQILQNKVNELEIEVRNLKSSLKNNLLQQPKNINHVFGINKERSNSRNAIGIAGQEFSEQKLAARMLKIFTTSFKNSVPSSFMR
jgi:mRNA-degrading endonuclease HigB of HigAB toxin-antitoxin module